MTKTLSSLSNRLLSGDTCLKWALGGSPGLPHLPVTKTSQFINKTEELIKKVIILKMIEIL
jgi:hypothetical protein